jgi:predicted rRNA methylase YqxC with S4 and FtsJ domains
VTNKKVMTVATLQKRVKENISFLEDKTILEKINQLIDENSQVYILSEKQLELVKEAQEQYKKGDYITQDEMDKKVDLWSKRK